ncbi:MAG: hypothetical protein ACRDHE_17030, partial [Ktedonobacterales bacterium]
LETRRAAADIAQACIPTLSASQHLHHRSGHLRLERCRVHNLPAPAPNPHLPPAGEIFSALDV